MQDRPIILHPKQESSVLPELWPVSLASRGITVNGIAPGFVGTDMTKVLPEQVREAATAQIPLGRFGQPEDIANMAVYLASEKASYITGQIISVDGSMAIG